MAGCRHCDFGIMTLSMGSVEVKAPCLNCSPDRKLDDLLRERRFRDDEAQKEIERPLIAEHNERMNGQQ